MGAEEHLERFVQQARAHRSTSSRGDAEARVEAILDELQMPRRSAHADTWIIDSDVGEVRVGLSEDDEILSIWQLYGPITGKPKRNGEFYRDLLMINRHTLGAAVAIEDVDGEDWLLVIARLAAVKLDKEEVALALQDVFTTINTFDPTVTSDEAQ